MSQIRVDDYGDAVCQGYDLERIHYHTFGSYQGEWMLLARDAENYYIYKGSYGSCSGCDVLEGHGSTFDSKQTLKEWLSGPNDDDDSGYKSFLEIPIETMRNVISDNVFGTLFPANIRDEFSEISIPEFVDDARISVKVRENLDINVNDILACVNQEVKQAAIKKYGYEKFVKYAEFDKVDEDGENYLLKKDDITFVSLKDSSTQRRYLLRVPPGMDRVKQAIAWTFNMEEHQYRPLVEA